MQARKMMVKSMSSDRGVQPPHAVEQSWPACSQYVLLDMSWVSFASQHLCSHLLLRHAALYSSQDSSLRALPRPCSAHLVLISPLTLSPLYKPSQRPHPCITAACCDEEYKTLATTSTPLL